jgi:glyoxylase-like metal-dependent hydrolase (beta-lactamase superfamily II)
LTDNAIGRSVQFSGGDLQRACWTDRLLPPVEEVAEGLWSIPVPIPDNPLRYTLAYVFLGPEGALLVDPGWNHPDSWTALQTGLRRAGTDVREVLGVIVTHIHHDHYGLAGRVRRRSGAWVGLHAADRLSMRLAEVDAVGSWDREMLRAGFPADEAAALAVELGSWWERDLAEPPDRVVADGDLLEVGPWKLRVTVTPGHSAGHVCLRDEQTGLLVTGDHVLPRITSNVGVGVGSTADPLGDYLASLGTVADHEPPLVLPAHQWRFRGLGDRVDHITRHHEDRLSEVVAVLGTQWRSPYEVARRLGWARGWDALVGLHRHAAVSEAHAHLVHAVARGVVCRRDAGGVEFSAAG